MTLSLVRLANIVFAALIAGGMFVIWAGYDPSALSPSTYVEQQQNAIRALNILMPVLGAMAVLLTLISAVLQRKDRTAFVLLIVAAAFLIISGLVTRLGNQPINDLVMTWDIARPPQSGQSCAISGGGSTGCGPSAVSLRSSSSPGPRRGSREPLPQARRNGIAGTGYQDAAPASGTTRHRRRERRPIREPP